jgi:hypothetical protein
MSLRVGRGYARRSSCRLGPNHEDTMRRIVTVVLLAVAPVLAVGIVAGLPSTAVADDPAPVVILGTPPVELRHGADAMIRRDGAQWYEGLRSRNSEQRIEQSITQFQRAVSFVRVCSVDVAGRMRVHGTAGGQSFRVRYRVGRHDVTRSVIAGSYRTRSLRSNACATRIRVIARLKAGAASNGRTFRIEATPSSGRSDTVSTHVTVVGPLAVP